MSTLGKYGVVLEALQDFVVGLLGLNPVIMCGRLAPRVVSKGYTVPYEKTPYVYTWLLREMKTESHGS